MRVVIDTNVLISALVFQMAATVWLRVAWETEAIRPLVCDRTLSELRRVLRYPRFRMSGERINMVQESYEPWCEMITIPHPPPQVPDCRDPGDRIFLELAQFAQADALITGDDDLLALASAFPIPIITPGDLRLRLGIAAN